MKALIITGGLLLATLAQGKSYQHSDGLYYDYPEQAAQSNVQQLDDQQPQVINQPIRQVSNDPLYYDRSSGNNFQAQQVTNNDSLFTADDGKTYYKHADGMYYDHAPGTKPSYSQQVNNGQSLNQQVTQQSNNQQLYSDQGNNQQFVVNQPAQNQVHNSVGSEDQFTAKDGKTYYKHADGMYYDHPQGQQQQSFQQQQYQQQVIPQQQYQQQAEQQLQQQVANSDDQFTANDGKTYYKHADGMYYDHPQGQQQQSFQQPQLQVQQQVIPQQQYQQQIIPQQQFQQQAQPQVANSDDQFTASDGKTYYKHSDGMYYDHPQGQRQMIGQMNSPYQNQQQFHTPQCNRPYQQMDQFNNFRQFNQFQHQQQQRPQVSSFRSKLQALAQRKANILASRSPAMGLYHPRISCHDSVNFGGAGHEGVGYSSRSAQEAINKCCYSGHPTSAKQPGYPRLATAVARGSNGWYAVILTR